MRGAGPKILVAAVAVLLPFAASLVVMTQLQTDLLFPVHAVPDAGPIPSGAEQWELETSGGERLRGVHFPPTRGTSEKLLLVGFGGNAWNGQHVADYLHQSFPEANVVAFHYRGYPPSTGSPSADALVEDAPVVLNHAIGQIRPDRTIAIGFSIGSGVAASLARTGRLDGLILVTPFDSLKAVASELYPWLPVGPLFQHEIDAAGMLSESQLPVAVIAAERDEIIPQGRTDALRGRIANLVFDRTIPGAGHNDIYGRRDFESALHDAFVTVARK